MQSAKYRETIREKMADRGWSQSDLAVAAGISPSALSRFFNTPDRDIDVSTLMRIADALRVLPGDLLPHTTEAIPPDVAPMMELLLQQPTEMRRKLEEMARVLVGAYEIGCTSARVGRNGRVGQAPTHTLEVTPVTDTHPASVQTPQSSSAIPGVNRTVSSVFIGPETGDTNAQQQQQRRKHSNKAKAGEPNHGDDGR